VPAEGKVLARPEDVVEEANVVVEAETLREAVARWRVVVVSALAVPDWMPVRGDGLTGTQHVPGTYPAM
jgi:hypothetical protein